MSSLFLFFFWYVSCNRPGSSSILLFVLASLVCFLQQQCGMGFAGGSGKVGGRGNITAAPPDLNGI